MTIGDRISLVRKHLNLNQEDFGKRINVTRSAVSNYEKGTRNIMDRVISDICREFNVNEKWLCNGVGEMFIEPDTFSLDEYLKQKGATDLEKNIVESVVKSYFEVSEEFRDDFINNLINNFKQTLNTEDCACEYDDIPNEGKSIEERIAEAEREHEIKVLGKKSEQLDTRDKILNFKPVDKSDKEHA